MIGYNSIGDVVKDIVLVGVLISLFIGGRTLFYRFQKARLEAIAQAENRIMAAQLKRVDIPIDLNWTVQSIDGQQVNLSDFKGKVLFVNMWATWCAPCRKEMPSLERLWHRFEKRNDIAFLMVSNESFHVVQKFLKRNSYNFPVYVAERGNAGPFNVNALPTTFIVSKKSRIVAQAEASLQWDSERPINLLESQLNDVHESD